MMSSSPLALKRLIVESTLFAKAVEEGVSGEKATYAYIGAVQPALLILSNPLLAIECLTTKFASINASILPTSSRRNKVANDALSSPDTLTMLLSRQIH